MNTQEISDMYYGLYEYMKESKDPKNMILFGDVMNEMMNWFIQNKPDAAMLWTEKLSSIKWKNFLTRKEADMIVSQMEPKAPWSREQWKQSMERHGLPLDEEPYYNRCALYAAMNMIMSDSSGTIERYVDVDSMFRLVHDLAVDKLKDADGKFNIRTYFGV